MSLTLKDKHSDRLSTKNSCIQYPREDYEGATLDKCPHESSCHEVAFRSRKAVSWPTHLPLWFHLSLLSDLMSPLAGNRRPLYLQTGFLHLYLDRTPTKKKYTQGCLPVCVLLHMQASKGWGWIGALCILLPLPLTLHGLSFTCAAQ